MSQTITSTGTTLIGEAANAVRDAVAQAYRDHQRAAEADRRRRAAERLVAEQQQVRAHATQLLGELDELMRQPDADVIADAVTALRDRATRCAAVQAEDLSELSSLQSDLRAVERKIKRAAKQLQAAQVSRAREGLSGQLQALSTQFRSLDERESRRFDGAGYTQLLNELTAAGRSISANNIDAGAAAIASAGKRLDEHLERVAAGREAHEQQRAAARVAAEGIVDRFATLSADTDFAAICSPKLAALQPDLATVNRLLAEEQFENVHVQVRRLEERLEQIGGTVRAELEQREAQKATAQRLIHAMLTQKGTLVKSDDRSSAGGKTELHFRVPNHGVIHIQILGNGKLSVCADGFKHSQRRVGGAIEKDYSEFVSWFESIRSAARELGLEMTAPDWQGKPRPDRAGAAALPATRAHYDTAKPQQKRRSL